MTDKVRCPSCRGSKKVPKLGGMIGECNTCNGSGQIMASEKVSVIIPEPIHLADSLVKQVADCVPVAVAHKIEIETVPVDKPIKVDPKRTIYKRKKA